MKPGRIVEIKSYGSTLKKSRGFLVIKTPELEDKVPLDDLSILIVHAGSLLSSDLLESLVVRSVQVLFLDSKRSPIAHLSSEFSSPMMKDRLLKQFNASKPNSKKIWAEIVKRKIFNQYYNLVSIDADFKESKLRSLPRQVSSGDPQNIEAQAARIYWPLLFGINFRREKSLDGTNSQLNFGYTIIRNVFLKYITSSGLFAGIGVFHRNPRNTGALADDLMEPYRPFIDNVIYLLNTWGEYSLSPDVKNYIATTLESRINFTGNYPTLEGAIYQTVRSYVECLESKKPGKIFFPDFPEGGIKDRPDFEVSGSVATSSF